MKTALAIAATLAVSFYAAPLFAQHPNHVVVQSDDLNLSSPGGRATLDSRIEVAIRTVCGRPNTGSRHDVAQARQCRNEARAAAAAQRSTKIALNPQR